MENTITTKIRKGYESTTLRRVFKNGECVGVVGKVIDLLKARILTWSDYDRDLWQFLYYNKNGFLVGYRCGFGHDIEEALCNINKEEP